MKGNIMIVGVGGQGTLLASKLLGKLFLEKGLDGEKMAAAMKEAADLRAAGSRVLLVWANKNKKFQKEQLTKAGYDEFREYYREELKH